VRWVYSRSVQDVDRRKVWWLGDGDRGLVGLERISIISCRGKNVTESFPGVSFMTIIGPWRMEASACMYNFCMFLGIGSGRFSPSILLLSVLIRRCLLGFLFVGGHMFGRVQWPGVAIRRYLRGKCLFALYGPH